MLYDARFTRTSTQDAAVGNMNGRALSELHVVSRVTGTRSGQRTGNLLLIAATPAVL